MEVKEYKNGMVQFDNGTNLLMIRKPLVKSIQIFPPDADPGSITQTKHWRVQVAGEGYIVFNRETREQAVELVNIINYALEEDHVVFDAVP